MVQLKKAAGVCHSCGPDIRRLKGNVAVGLAKEMFEQGGLAGLTGSGQNHRRKFRRRPESLIFTGGTGW